MGDLASPSATKRSTGTSTSRGHLLTGSAAMAGRDRTRMAELMLQIEDNQSEIEMQRAEIRRLREQVHTLLSRAEQSASTSPDDSGSARLQRPFSTASLEHGAALSEHGMARATSALR